MKKQSQSGFAVIELIAVVFILVVIAGVGYFVWHGHNTKSPTNAASTSGTSSQAASTSVPTAPQVTSASDLNSAMSALNQTDITSSNTDSSQLSTEASGF